MTSKTTTAATAESLPPPPQPASAAEADAEESRPTLRLCRILKHAVAPATATATATPASASSCGFHISRTQWDPYPWVSAVEVGSPAEQAGLRAGDCVLEVNGEDVLGQRIGEVAAKVRAARAKHRLQLLVWNAGCDPGTAVTLTAGSAPTPLNLQLLSSCLQQASQLLECPVCLEAVSPPVWQCCHGHLLCSGCRARSERCPLCRVPLGPRGRSLLADKLHELLSQTQRRYSEQRQPAAGRVADVPASTTTTTTTTKTSVATIDAEPPPRAHVQQRGLRLTASSEDLSDVAADAVAELALADHPDDAAAPPAAVRARSQSAGHIGVHAAKTVAELNGAGGGLVHCPYGSSCSSTFPASEVFQHVSEDHDGPLTQYFPREGRALSLPHPGQGQRRHSLTVLTTKAGESMFLHEERGCLWLWTLAAADESTGQTTPAADAAAVVVPEPFLCVDFPDAGHVMVPVFPLSASSDDVIASGRCVQMPAAADEGLRLSLLSVRDVMMTAAVSMTARTATTLAPPSATVS